MITLALMGCPSPTPTDGPPPAPTPTDVPTLPQVELIELDAPVCEAPELRDAARFTAFTLPATEAPSWVYLWGAGISASDFDGDGTDELVVVHERSLSYLDWDGSTWSARDGLPDLPLQRGFGAAAADVDDDGDRDLYITQMKGSNHLLLNDGTGRFTESTPPLLSGTPEHHSAASTFADLDGDGDLDLLVAGHGHVDEVNADPTQFEPADPTLLFWNQQGEWVDGSTAIPSASHDRYTFIGGTQDLDLDGDLDLLMINDFGRRYGACQLLWNQDGTFVEDGNAVGLDMNVAGMGLSWADLNQDGVPDPLVPYWAGYKLMLSSTGGWFDYSNVSGLRPAVPSGQEVGWGANFGDLDNDGRLDATVMHGWLDTAITANQHDQPDGLFAGIEAGFDNVTQDWDHIDIGDNRGLVVADFDRNGWLDIARPSLNGPTRVYMANCGTAAWLELELEQPGPNRDAIGAVVVVDDGERQRTRYLLAGGEGYGSSNPRLIHVGLGSALQVDVDVRWPDGRIDRFEQVATKRRYRIQRH